MAGLDRLNPLEPHHATTLGAGRVLHVIDSAFHREIKARTDGQAQLPTYDRLPWRSAPTGVPPVEIVETYRRMVSVCAKVLRYDTEE